MGFKSPEAHGLLCKRRKQFYCTSIYIFYNESVLWQSWLWKSGNGFTFCFSFHLYYSCNVHTDEMCGGQTDSNSRGQIAQSVWYLSGHARQPNLYRTFLGTHSIPRLVRPKTKKQTSNKKIIHTRTGLITGDLILDAEEEVERRWPDTYMYFSC